MTAPSRDPEVVRWLRRPIWWLLGVAALFALFAIGPLLDLWHEAGIRRDGVAATGSVLGSWDGGRRVPVAYVPPGGGDRVEATAWGPVDHDLAVGPVAVQVDPDAPDQVRIAGPLPLDEVVEQVTLFVPILLALLIWLGTRHRCVRRSERLASSEQPAYRMVGVPVPGRFARRRWRMHLYALDEAPGAPPVCTVPMITTAGSTVRRTVDVKGEPRAGGVLVAADPGSGRIWWPAGRALVTGRTPLPEVGAPAADLDVRSRWWLLALGALLLLYSLIGGEDPEAVAERSETTTATVVEGHGSGVEATPVRYRVDGTAHEASPSLAGPQRAGDRIVLAYDPEAPGRVWQPGTHGEIPGTTPPGDVYAFMLGILLIGLGVVLALPPRPERWSDGRGGGLLPLR